MTDGKKGLFTFWKVFFFFFFFLNPAICFIKLKFMTKFCSLMNMTSKSKNIKLAKFISCILELF